ncbi:MAG TPA: FeoA family protein [Syntrophorhabdaceae bacterium]|nr:FeoA family protein [Syntrophorhabdaceae bacterium]
MSHKAHFIPLAYVNEGSRVRIVRMDLGRGLKARLTAMGIIPNTEIEVVMNSLKGPFVISIKGSRIILGRGIASKIMVT